MTQACSLALCHGHSLDLETLNRESLADPEYGSETNPAIAFACRVLQADLDVGKKTVFMLPDDLALMLNMNALVPAIASAYRKPR
jgi:hypothetical protein